MLSLLVRFVPHSLIVNMASKVIALTMANANALENMISRLKPSDIDAVSIMIKKNKPTNHLEGNVEPQLFLLAWMFKPKINGKAITLIWTKRYLIMAQLTELTYKIRVLSHQGISRA